MIISFVQTKGGTGKSTLALGTAFSPAVHDRFPSIALVELDPQGTLRNWWRERESQGLDPGKVSFHHITSSQKSVLQESIRTIAGHNACIILDIPGESTGKLHTRFACAISDLVVIPLRTSTNDESALADNLYPIVKEVVKLAPQKRSAFYVLPAFVHPQTNSRKILEYFAEILPPHLTCLQAVYPVRSAYENFNREGMSLLEYVQAVKSNKRLKQQAARAMNDMEAIARALLNTKEEI